MFLSPFLSQIFSLEHAQAQERQTSLFLWKQRFFAAVRLEEVPVFSGKTGCSKNVNSEQKAVKNALK